MLILEIITFIFVAVFIVLLFSFAVFGTFYIIHFQWRKCKHCGHSMNYKGLKPDENCGHYLFHCPKCGAWEQIPTEEFFNSIDKTNIDKYDTK